MKSWCIDENCSITKIIGGRCNVYFVVTPTFKLLIDTSTKRNKKWLLLRLKRLNVDSIDWLILTHTHFDHCQNAALIKEKYNCKIAVSKNAENYIALGHTPLPKGTFLYSKLIVRIGNKLLADIGTFDPFNAELLVNQTTQLENDATIKLMPVPGHSSVSLAVIINKKAAIVGDALFGVLPRSIYPPFADDKRMMLENWKKLLSTGCHFFLPGHGSFVSRKRLKIAIDKISK